MSNQNQVIVEAGVKSTPDISILTSMQNPVVMCTKLFIDGGGAKRAGKDVLVVNGMTGLDVGGILQLQDDLPDLRKYRNGGPGTYRFEVTDQGTTTKEVWQVRLGVVNDDAPNPGFINRPGGVGQSPISVALRSPAVTAPVLPAVPLSADVESLGNGFLYHTKYRILTVPDGRMVRWDPSQPLPDLSLPIMPMPAAPVSIVSASQPQSMSPSPELAELRAQNAAMGEALARMREEARDRQRESELTALRREHSEQIATLATEFKSFAERVSATPREDPRVADLERRLADRDRETAIRSEFGSKVDQIAALVRDSQVNRGPDPMVISVIDFLKTQLAATQNTALTPDKALALQRDVAGMIKESSSSPLNEKMVAIMGSMLDMVMRFREAESHLGNNSGVDWMGMLQTVVDRAGTAIQAFTQTQSRKAVAEAAKANADAVRARRDIVITEAQKTQKAAQSTSIAEVAAPPTGEAARDALAAEMFRPPTAAPSTPAVPTAPPVVAAPPAPAAPAQPRKRGKSNPLARATIDEIRKAFDDKDDKVFFGPFADLVQEIREALPGDNDHEPLTPDDAADAVLEAAQHMQEAIAANGGRPPLVADMLVLGRFDYIFERLLPEAGATFWIQAATALQAKIAAAKAAAE
jgi:hypothetical protein